MASSPNYALITTAEELAQLLGKLVSDGRPFGFDIETGYDGETREDAAKHPEENFIAGLSFTNSLSWARYVAIGHDTGPNLNPAVVAALFWPLMRTGLGVAHNAAFELRCMSRWFMEHLADHPEYGEEVRRTKGYFPVLSDSMIEAYIVAGWQSYALKGLTRSVFGYEQPEIWSLYPPGLTKKDKDSIRFNVLDPLDLKVVAYACEDSVWCLALHLEHYPQVKDKLLYKTEMSILYIVCEMEDFGVKYDWNFMREGAQRGKTFKDKLQLEVQADLQGLIARKTGEATPLRINLGSPAQVGSVLYDKLGLRTKVMTKGGKSGVKKMSTGAIALKGLSKQYPVVRKILNWKNLTKLIGTYLDKYERVYGYCPCGLTHPNHMQCAVISGRFAVSSPPYQQSPKKYHYELADGTEFNFNFRDAIVAPSGYYILGFDYSQIELRVIAGEAKEQALIDAFLAGEDVHRKTASLMLGKPLEQVTDADRAIGKTMNFALMYQMGVDGLADRLGISFEEAEELFNQYFAVYANIKQWIDTTVADAKQNGFTKSRFGRKHMIWEFQSEDRYIRSKGERLAGNAPIQGGAADYMKIAMVRAQQAIRKAGLADKVHLVMNIHDALEFYVHKSVPPKHVIDALENPGVMDEHSAITFPVAGWPPMKAEWHAGLRWGSVEELEFSAGQLRVKGKDSPDLVEEATGDDEEDGPSLAGVDTARIKALVGSKAITPGSPEAQETHVLASRAVAAVFRTPTDPDAPPRKVIVTVGQLPQAEQYKAFLRLASASPGRNTLVLRTPGGDVTVSDCTGLSPEVEADISMALGGAEVKYAPESVDSAALADGILF